MANALFAKGKENILIGNIDIDTNDIKIVCVDHADDTPVPATDDALDDIAAGGRVGTSGNLASKTCTDGVFDAADVTISTVTGDPFESLVFYKDSGVAGTSYLFLYIDTATGLPCTPNGGDITIAFDSGANKIFAW